MYVRGIWTDGRRRETKKEEEERQRDERRPETRAWRPREAGETESEIISGPAKINRANVEKEREVRRARTKSGA